MPNRTIEVREHPHHLPQFCDSFIFAHLAWAALRALVSHVSLIPWRNRDHSYDPTRPSQGNRAGLQELLAIADVKVQRYDLRYHAVSRALSNPLVPLEAAKAYFGWMSPKMVQRYYHANQAAMRVVATALDEKPPEPTKPTKPRRKATVVEIQARPITAPTNRLYLPSPKEER